MAVREELSCGVNDARVKVFNGEASNWCNTSLRSLAPFKLRMTHLSERDPFGIVDSNFAYELAFNAATGVFDLNNVSLVDRRVYRDETRIGLDMCLDRKTLLVGSALGVNYFNSFVAKRTEHWRLNGHENLLSNLKPSAQG